ncbi:MAG: hypothetical protein K1X78_15455 [Verrucomicrobiaceae bacterium]|nr:hypothetical protein [Verrucomicrobiaceae bacterium]
MIQMDWPGRGVYGWRIMKLFVLSAVFCIGIGSASGATPRLAFERDSTVWISGLDGKGLKKIARGALPQISPDGTRVAFNTIDPDAKSLARHIAVADITSGKVTVLKQTPSDNCFGPAWSPDGTRLLFSIWLDNNWHLAAINADGSGYAVVKKSAGVSDSIYSPAWAADGKSFFCHDLEAIYRCDLTGKVTKTWKLADILEHGGMNSGDRLSPSPDGTRLLMDADMDEEHSRENWDGPPPAVWSLDLEGGKAVRLSKTGLFAWDPAWIDDEEFVFISQGSKEKTPSLYRRAVGSGGAKLVLKDVRTPSVSR